MWATFKIKLQWLQTIWRTGCEMSLAPGTHPTERHSLVSHSSSSTSLVEYSQWRHEGWTHTNKFHCSSRHAPSFFYPLQLVLSMAYLVKHYRFIKPSSSHVGGQQTEGLCTWTLVQRTGAYQKNNNHRIHFAPFETFLPSERGKQYK